MSTDVIRRCPISFSPRFHLRVRTRASECVENFFSIFIMDENSDSSSSSEEELELMAFAVALLEKKKKKRKHRVWVKEIFQNRGKKDGLHKLVNVMRVSNRECYFK